MTLFKKSIITLSAAVLGFSAILVVSVFVFMNTLYYEINMTGLKNTAKTLLTEIGSDRVAEFFDTIQHDTTTTSNIPLSLNVNDAFRLTLIAPSGYVLWDSHVANSLVNHIDREEVAAALDGREGSSRRNSISTGLRRIYYALPIFDNNEVVGVFRLSLSIPGFGARVSPIFLPFVIFICIFIIAAFWAIIMFSRSLSESLGRLVNIAQTSTLLLSDPQAVENVTLEFRSLEKALRVMSEELNLRFEQAKSEGNRLEAILNGMSEAVFTMDSSFRLHLVNPKARELFNLGSRDIKSISLLEVTRSTELLEIAKKAISGSMPIEAELTFHTGAAQKFLVYASSLSSQKTGETKNETIGVVLVLQDITRLVKLERIRKDFVANVSHELRTPIQLIKGFSETMLDGSIDFIKDKEKTIHFLEIIYKNAGIMENLTNDLLILADLENKNDNTRDMEKVNILLLIKEAVLLTETQAANKKIEININCPDELEIKLYGSLIIQALVNLIDNGIKYSSEKSKLWVSACLTETNGIDGQNELLINVRDKGIGIPAEHQQRIFERFYQVERAKSREVQTEFARGIGLGLSIVRHIALLHKGNAEVESHAGEGSTFRIRIPVQA